MATEKALVFVLRANISDFNKKLGDVERNFKKTFGNISKELQNISKISFGIGAAIVAPLALAFKDAASWGDDIEELSLKIGFTIEETQRWSNMMKIAGGDGNDIAIMVKKMTSAYDAATSATGKANDKYDELSDKYEKALTSGKATTEQLSDMVEELEGSEISGDKASQAFARLNINLDDFGKLDTEGRLRAIFVALSSISDSNEQQGIVGALLGKGGQKALIAASGDVEAFLASMNIMSEETVRKLAKAKDAMDKLGIAWQNTIGTFVAATFGGDATNWIDTLTKELEKLSKWMEEHKDEVKNWVDSALTIAKIAIVIGTVTAVADAILKIKLACDLAKASWVGLQLIMGVGGAVTTAGTWAAGWSGSIGIVLGLIGGFLQTLAAGLVTFFAGLGLGLIAAFVAALIGVGFFIWTIVSNWEILSTAKWDEVWSNICTIITGWINIAVNNIRMAFDQAKTWVITKWNEVIVWFQNLPTVIQAAFANMVTWLTQPFVDAWAEIQRVANQIKTAWDNLFSGGGGTITVSANAGVQKYASGGIFTRPTLGIIGDVPEAVIPLSQLGRLRSSGSTVNVNVGNYIGDDLSKRALVRDLQRIMNEETRRSVHKPTETNFYSVGGHL